MAGLATVPPPGLYQVARRCKAHQASGRQGPQKETEMTIKYNNHQAYISKHESTGKWIFCLVQGNLIEGDSIAARHGQFNTRREAREAFIRFASQWA